MKKLQTDKKSSPKKASPKKSKAVKKAPAKKAPAKKAPIKKAPAAKVLEVSQSQLLARELAEMTLSRKATDVRILDLRNLTTIADFFVICTAHSDTQVKAVADAVVEGSKSIGERPWHKEGFLQKSWVLLDYVDVVVHVFLKDTREFYSLEKLWGDAPVEEIEDK